MTGTKRTVRAMFLSSFMLLFLMLGAAGCGGGGARLQSESYCTTLGQELKDLEDAYKRGIISERQYESAKEKLIEQRTEK